MIHRESVQIQTRGFGEIVDVTPRVAEVVRRSGCREGLVTVFCPGSTAAVTTIEYEPGVLRDLQRALEELVPSDRPYEHDRRWGDGNGFSHVRAALLKPGLTVPVADGAPVLGTWQQIVFVDFDNRPRRRRLLVQVLGEAAARGSGEEEPCST